MRTLALTLGAVMIFSTATIFGGKLGLDALKQQAQAAHVQKTGRQNAQMQALLAQL